MGAIGGAGVFPRRTVTINTASLAINASENDDVQINKSALVYSITTNRPARIRAYTTAAKRSADASRQVGVDPSGNHGLLFEVVTSSGLLTFDIMPTMLTNMDTPAGLNIYFATTNLDTVAGVVTVTLTVRRAE